MHPVIPDCYTGVTPCMNNEYHLKLRCIQPSHLGSLEDASQNVPILVKTSPQEVKTSQLRVKTSPSLFSIHLYINFIYILVFVIPLQPNNLWFTEEGVSHIWPPSS